MDLVVFFLYLIKNYLSKYFWQILPIFNGTSPILGNEVNIQKEFLKNNKIVLTDLLISIDDANNR